MVNKPVMFNHDNFFSKNKIWPYGENKTGKYLKNALGEIVLVVIGILIAIQLNSAKQNNDKRVKAVPQNFLIDTNRIIIDKILNLNI